MIKIDGRNGVCYLLFHPEKPVKELLHKNTIRYQAAYPKLKDLNGDGINDLLLFTRAGARGCNVYYEVMIFNKAQQSLRLLKYREGDELSDPQYNATYKWITSSNCTADSYEHYYTIRGDSLKLIGWAVIRADYITNRWTYAEVHYSAGAREKLWKIKGGDFSDASNLLYKKYHGRK